MSSFLKKSDESIADGEFNAIVIGAGATGGLSALLLAEAGLKVLVLDAGPNRHSLNKSARKFSFRVARRVLGEAAPLVMRSLKSNSVLKKLIEGRQPVQSQCYAWPLAPEQFVDDYECPYINEEGSFVWLRARQLGGRMVIPGHGRQYYRFAEEDLCPNDGLTPVWPIKYSELTNWYDYVERKLELSGLKYAGPLQPCSYIANELTMSATEQRLCSKVMSRWPSVQPILGVSAPPLNSLEVAARTGRVAIQRGAIAKEIEVSSSGRVSGVIWSHLTGAEPRVSRAPVVFVCASALESTRLLLLSERARGGIGVRSGVLGRNLMDHIKVNAVGVGPSNSGRSQLDPVRCIYLPRFDLRNSGARPTSRGFGIQLYYSFGEGKVSLTSTSFGEMLPRSENHVKLDTQLCDAWGVPILRVTCRHSEMDNELAKQQAIALEQMSIILGMSLIEIDEHPASPGMANHECGTARMGTTPANSVLNGNNECWEAKGLYVTDGACLPSLPSQNPTLTLMALTARACDHAVRSLGSNI